MQNTTVETCGSCYGAEDEIADIKWVPNRRIKNTLCKNKKTYIFYSNKKNPRIFRYTNVDFKQKI